jgi:hypothetical protein
MPNAPEHRYPVIELRQDTLHPGQRDTLIDLFDREFIETQKAVGTAVRAEALAAFYGGPVWQRHRDAAHRDDPFTSLKGTGP